MNTTCRKHWYLKFGADRGAAPWFWAHRLHEINFSLDVAFVLAGETLDTPNNGMLFWLVLSAAERMLDLCLSSVLWHGNLNNHMRRKELVGKVGNHFEIDRHSSQQKKQVSEHCTQENSSTNRKKLTWCDSALPEQLE